MMEGMTTDSLVHVSDERARGLRRFNLGLGVLHLVSGSLMVLLGDLSFELPVTVFSDERSTGHPDQRRHSRSRSAVSRSRGAPRRSCSCPRCSTSSWARSGSETYLDELRHGRNRFRWVEYSLSATLMIVLIAGITGITDVAALIAIAFVNAAMILFGWVMEMVNDPSTERARGGHRSGSAASPASGPGSRSRRACAAGSASTAPTSRPRSSTASWCRSSCCSTASPSTSGCSTAAPANGPTTCFGERVYGVLSLVAKSALAWQIFVNTLVG